jgi:hypothetical protein
VLDAARRESASASLELWIAAGSREAGADHD